MMFEIRTAIAADIPAMHAVRCKVRENRLSDPKRITQASYLPYIAAGSAWVAEADGVVTGFAALNASDAKVWALFVDPNAEGAGIGQALHQRLLDWARWQSIPRLKLSTDRSSRAARFYELAGWTSTGTNAEGEVLFELQLRAHF
jgi:GNAT superfamily N-acetyltransferase